MIDLGPVQLRLLTRAGRYVMPAGFLERRARRRPVVDARGRVPVVDAGLGPVQLRLLTRAGCYVRPAGFLERRACRRLDVDALARVLDAVPGFGLESLFLVVPELQHIAPP